MEYEIKNINRSDNSFEVDVEYIINNKKNNIRFSFGIDSWKNEAWKRSIETRLDNIKNFEDIEVEKIKYINKKFKSKRHETTDESSEVVLTT